MTSLPETRASLILRLPDGADVQAWDEFAAIYGPLVYRLARRQGLQPADADDLVQEVLSAVARSVEGWLHNGQRGPFRAWLLRIAKNAAINVLTRKRHQPLAAGGHDLLLAQTADPAGELSGEFDLEYRREVFRWAATQLRDLVADSTWQAFWRTSVEEQPIERVAQELKMSVGSVYIARSRVMARLRELARNFGENER
ncbi:MAG TPA: sigma-70 family RNA polymerase sigma factor [Pirellulaceae bacterium]|nr:sigma-70 family RNA polymerase sigma factor [Pirellulaceae bacterium]